MYTLSVAINDGPPVIAGSDELHSLSAMLTCRIDASAQANTLSLGGSILPVTGVAARHLHWLDELGLQVGDMVTISLRDDILPDAPSPNLPLLSRERSERFMFENCKRAYFALRHQYEAPQQDMP